MVWYLIQNILDEELECTQLTPSDLLCWLNYNSRVLLPSDISTSKNGDITLHLQLSSSPTAEKLSLNGHPFNPIALMDRTVPHGRAHLWMEQFCKGTVH